MLFISGRSKRGYTITDTEDGVSEVYTKEQIASFPPSIHIRGVENGVVKRAYTLGEMVTFLQTYRAAIGKSGNIVIAGMEIAGTVVVGCTHKLRGTVVVPDGITEIADFAFAESYIEGVVLPISLQRIGESAFQNSNLASVVIPPNVEEIGEAAFTCQLESVKFSGNKLKAIKKSTFYHAELKSVTIPEGVTDIGEGAFACCLELKRLVLPRSIEHIESEAFDSCFSLRRIFLPADLDMYRLAHKVFSYNRDWALPYAPYEAEYDTLMRKKKKKTFVKLSGKGYPDGGVFDNGSYDLEKLPSSVEINGRRTILEDYYNQVTVSKFVNTFKIW